MQDAEPALYLYVQRFTVPGITGKGSTSELERRGIIALGRIEDYSAGVVFRHEQTLAKPKADRLNLLRATRAHFGQLFMLYSDPAGEIDGSLKPDRPLTWRRATKMAFRTRSGRLPIRRWFAWFATRCATKSW